MQRSLLARYAVPQVPEFPVPASRSRGPRLGLHRQSWFVPSARTPTVLRRVDSGSVTLLRPGWRAVTPDSHRGITGFGGPLAAVRWAKLDGRAPARRARATSAPWRG